jgi:NitT/TauT family transport system permease protein
MSVGVEAPAPPVGPDGSAGRRRRSRRLSHDTVRVYVLRVAVLAVALVGWQLLGTSSAKTSFFISNPVAVWDSLMALLPTSDFWLDVGTTLEEMIIGFVIGGVAGVLLGFLLAFSPTAHRVLDPILNALNSLPRIALASLFILYFGLGLQAKIALVISLVFFPLFLNAYKGATTIDPDYQLLMHTMKAGRVQYVRMVTLPSTVPWLISGAKLGLAQGLGGAVIGEIISAQHGLGAALNIAANAFDTGQEFAILIVLIVIAMALNGIFEWFERMASTWR